jgi:hypothetical protein
MKMNTKNKKTKENYNQSEKDTSKIKAIILKQECQEHSLSLILILKSHI